MGDKDGTSLMPVVRLGAACGHVSPELLKKSVFPRLRTWPELVVAQLEEAGLERAATVTPLLEWLIGQGKAEAAAAVAGIFPEHVDSKLHFLTPPSPPPPPQQTQAQQESAVRDVSEEEPTVVVSPVPDTDPSCQSVLAWDSQEAQPSPAQSPEVQVSPEIQTQACGGEANHPQPAYPVPQQQYSVQAFYDPVGQTYVPVVTPVMVQYADTAEFYYPYYLYQPPLPPLQPQYVPPNSPPQYVSPTSSPLPQQYEYVAPTPPLRPQYVAPTYSDRSYRNHSESSGYSTDDVPSITPSTREQTILHRQLKKAISVGHVRKGLATYNRLEATGKIVNVTETSALVEQLIRADMMREAAALTMSMLRRNTHPLPKVFRFLLNKLALAGAVEEMEAIGPYLGPKVKKDVSFDNRLCNAYLGAGRGEEFLDRLVADLDVAVRAGDGAGLEAAQARFPRGGAMGLL